VPSAASRSLPPRQQLSRIAFLAMSGALSRSLPVPSLPTFGAAGPERQPGVTTLAPVAACSGSRNAQRRRGLLEVAPARRAVTDFVLAHSLGRNPGPRRKLGQGRSVASDESHQRRVRREHRSSPRDGTGSTLDPGEIEHLCSF